MDTWKTFDANALSHSAAHHLLAIHEVGQPYGGWARVSDIARALNITRGSVSINLRALKKRGLVDTDHHRLVRLSAAGLRAAQAVLAKRTAVTGFLTSVLGVSAVQAEVDACKIEHLLSDETGRQLVHFVRLMTSTSPAAKDVLKRFRRSHLACPPSQTCELCQGTCLAAELAEVV